jgi:hypothetical protein
MGKRQWVAKRLRILASYAVAGNAAQVKLVLGGRRKGSPQMLCVKFHPVFFQKQHLFILKGGCPVMLDLMGNLFFHRRAIGNAHRDGLETWRRSFIKRQIVVNDAGLVVVTRPSPRN